MTPSQSLSWRRPSIDKKNESGYDDEKKTVQSIIKTACNRWLFSQSFRFFSFFFFMEMPHAVLYTFLIRVEKVNHFLSFVIRNKSNLVLLLWLFILKVKRNKWWIFRSFEFCVYLMQSINKKTRVQKRKTVHCHTWDYLTDVERGDICVYVQSFRNKNV